MSKRTDKSNACKEGEATPRLEEVIVAVEKLLRAALQEGRTKRGTEREAFDLYHSTTDSRGKTANLLAACLLDWPSFVQRLDQSAEEETPLGMDEITALLIHRVFLRKRRLKYRDGQMEQQLRNANVRDGNGEFMLFDPEDPRKWEESLKELREEIAYLLEGRSVRDRMVLELWLNQQTGKAIVEVVLEALPGERVSEATVSRIVDRFQDELRGRLQED